MLWSLNSRSVALRVGWSALALAVLGTVLMVLAPFVEHARPVMANYIPMLDGVVFRAGMAIFAGGAVLLVLRGLLAAPPRSEEHTSEIQSPIRNTYSAFWLI